MKCLNPQYAYYVKKSDGTFWIKFLPRETTPERAMSLGKDLVLEIPCGKCESCKKNYRFQWSLRCFLESLIYNKSFFLTLTYDDTHYEYASLKDVKRFLKDLRNNGFFVRYFGCSERGDKTKRLHFHLILFGIDLEDLYLNRFNKLVSPSLNSYWTNGFIQIDEFKPGHAFYVAGYVGKKEDKDCKLFMSRNLGKETYKFYKENSLDMPFYAPGKKVPRNIKALDKLLEYEVMYDMNPENDWKKRELSLKLSLDKRNRLL